MIVKTTKTINGIVYDYTYSDLGMNIERDGARYDEAVDPLNSGREYIETDEPIVTETDEGEATETDYQNALKEMGVRI